MEQTTAEAVERLIMNLCDRVPILKGKDASEMGLVLHTHTHVTLPRSRKTQCRRCHEHTCREPQITPKLAGEISVGLYNISPGPRI